MQHTTPTLIPVPFAENGDKNTIEQNYNDPSSGNATYSAGFPPITQVPRTSGGVPPLRQDVNGILYDLSSNIRYINAGGIARFDQAFCDAIGGYPKGAVLQDNIGEKSYVSLVDNNTVDFNTAEDFSDSWKEYGADGGNGAARFLGETFFSTTPVEDAGVHLADGSTLAVGGIYDAFITYIAGLKESYPQLFCTEEEWQASVAEKGVCGKYVYTDGVSLRIPNYGNKLYTDELADTAPVAGNGLTLGLAGKNEILVGLYESASEAFAGYTAVYGQPIGTSTTGGTGGAISNGTSVGVTTDPDNSGLIAQTSNISASIDGYWYIVVATSAKTDIQVDIDNITTDLYNKADRDLSNTNPSLSFATILNNAEIRTVVETWQSEDGYSWYRKWSDGWIEQGGIIVSTGSSSTKSVTFPVPFSDTNFFAIGTMINENTYSGYTSKSTTSIAFFTASSGGNKSANVNWYSCGY